MHDFVLLSIADWPEKLGTSWWAIGGAIGITIAVLVGIRVSVHFLPDKPEHD